MRWTCRPAELCRLARITASQLEHYVALGLIEPLHPAATPGGSGRIYSLTNLHEAALAAELVTAGITGQRLQAIFAKLHASLAGAPEPLKATLTFCRYVEAVKAIATILGQTNDPWHRKWLKDVDAIERQYRRTGAPVDDRLLQLFTLAQIAHEQASEDRR